MGDNLDLILALQSVVTFDDMSDFPTAGQTNILYFDESATVLYAWNGTQYVSINLSNNAFVFLGLYDASSNTPNAMTTLTTNGNALIVSVAGEQTIDTIAYTGANSLNVGDILVETSSGIRRVPLQTAIAQNVTSGRIPRVVNGELVDSAIREEATTLISDKTLVVPQGSIEVGAGLILSEVGGEIRVMSRVTGNTYFLARIPIDQPFDFSRIDRISYSKPSSEEQFFFSNVDSTTTTITTFQFVPTFSFLNTDLSFNVPAELTNFRIRVESDETNQDIRYFPSRRQWDNNIGVTLDANSDFEFFRAGMVIDGDNQLPFRYKEGITYTITYMADSPVILQGDGTVPWARGTIRRLTETPVADLQDTTGESIVATLEALTDDDRLQISALRGTITDDNAIHDNVDGEINALPTKSTLAMTDVLILEDSANGFSKVKSPISSIVGGMIVPTNPSVHNFRIDLPTRVDVGLTPDTVNAQHTVTFGISNYSLITGMVLHVGTETFTLTVPTRDGENQTQTVTLSGIDLSTATNYNMFIELNDDSNLRSNTVVLRVAQPVVHELLYWDVQAGNVASTFNFQSSTAESQEILGNTNTLTVQTFTGSMYLLIAQPASEDDFTSIVVNNLEQIGAFSTPNRNAITINSENYDVWVSNNALLGNLVSGNTVVVRR